jgi:hypothetical protein
MRRPSHHNADLRRCLTWIAGRARSSRHAASRSSRRRSPRAPSHGFAGRNRVGRSSPGKPSHRADDAPHTVRLSTLIPAVAAHLVTRSPGRASWNVTFAFARPSASESPVARRSALVAFSRRPVRGGTAGPTTGMPDSGRGPPCSCCSAASSRRPDVVTPRSSLGLQRPALLAPSRPRAAVTANLLRGGPQSSPDPKHRRRRALLGVARLARWTPCAATRGTSEGADPVAASMQFPGQTSRSLTRRNRGRWGPPVGVSSAYTSDRDMSARERPVLFVLSSHSARPYLAFAAAEAGGAIGTLLRGRRRVASWAVVAVRRSSRTAGRASVTISSGQV